MAKKLIGFVSYLISILFLLNLSYAGISFEEISLSNNSIINESNIKVDVTLLVNQSSGIDGDSYEKVSDPRVGVDNYADLMILSDDRSAEEFCQQNSKSSYLRYESSVKGNMYAYYNGVSWKKDSSWNNEKITQIYCDSNSRDFLTYYRLDGGKDKLLLENKLSGTLVLENLSLGTHNLSFHATDNLTMTNSGTYYFDVASTSNSCLLPDGTNIGAGKNVTMYQEDVVGFDETCTNETRVCENGFLSGSYKYSNCTHDDSEYRLSFKNISFKNNTHFEGRNVSINITLINYNAHIIKDPGVDVNGQSGIRVRADNKSASRKCYEETNSSTYYNYTKSFNNYIFTYWDGTKWVLAQNGMGNYTIDELYCEGYHNHADLYYQLDGNDYELVSSNLSYTNFLLDDLYYKNHTLQFFANHSKDNFVYSEVFEFTNNGSIPDNLSHIPGLLNESSPGEKSSAGILTKVLDWFGNMFV